MLAMTQGKMQTDTFEFLASFKPVKELVFVTDVAGIKHHNFDLGKIKVGDIIVSFNGVKLSDTSLAELVNKTKVGDKIKVEIYRWEDEKKIELNVKMKESLQ